MLFCICYKTFERSNHRWCSVGTDTNTWFPQNFQVFQIQGIKSLILSGTSLRQRFFWGGLNRQMPTNVLCQECQTHQLASWTWISVSWRTFFDLRCLSFLYKLHLWRTGSSQFLVLLSHQASLWQFDERWAK